ncbi:hypothetical protein [Kitasatospora sp. NPDC098663]|uniref:hypothetical protein n=1 Tax=Kitasatospora sp. NPDC098663 TaxID=3364096 RepID=UPI0037FA3F89
MATRTAGFALGANGNDAQRWAFWPTANGRWIIGTLLTDGKAAAGQGMVMDHDPGTHRAHLIRTMDGNADQHWPSTTPEAAGSGSPATPTTVA